jgi:PAS domain S-box-containing protein
MERKATKAAAEDRGVIGVINGFSIGRRLSLCFAGIFALLLAVNSILLWQFHSAHVTADRRLTGISQELIAVLNLQSSLRSFNDRLDRVAQLQDAVLLRQESASLRDMILETVRDTRNAITHLPPEVRPYPTVVPAIETIESTLPSQLQSLNALAASADWSAFRQRLANEKEPLDAETSMLVNSITRELNDELGRTVTNIARLERQMVTVLPVTALGTLLIASMLGLIITRSITTPLARLMDGSSALSRGEFDYQVPISGDDELAKLSRVFNDTSRKLQSLYDTLQDNKAKLEEAQRISHVGYWEWDLTTDCLNWSDETYRIFGLQPQERLMNADALREMVHPEDRERIFREKKLSVIDGVYYDVEHRIIRPGGEVRVLNSKRAVKKDASGRPIYFFGTVQDITDRKRAEDALQQSQFYLAEGQRLAHIGSWAFDANGFSHWSTELFRIHGLDSSGTPPTVEEYLALVHPEDRAFMNQNIARMLQDHLAFDFTTRIVRPDGAIRRIRCVGIPVAQGKVFHGFLGTGMDVTEQERLTEELRQSEHYLSEGQRLAHMGSWVFDPAGFFRYWSYELLRIYDLDPDQEAPSLEEYLALIHPQDREFMRSTIKQMVAEVVGCDVTKRIVRRDGGVRYIRCVGIPVVEHGTLQRIVGTAIDVTDHELLTQELRRREAYLAEAQRISHTGSFGWKPDSGEIVWSEETYRIFEYDRGRKPVLDMVVQRVHPDDKALAKQVIDHASQTGTDFEHEYRLLLPDGRIKHVHAIGRASQNASGSREFIGAVTDITESRAAEDKIRRLVEAGILGIFIANVAGEIVEANQTFLQLLQYSREDLVSGRLRWADLTPAEWRERDERSMAEFLATGVFRYEKEYFRKDGSRVPVLVGGARLHSANEGVVFVLDLSEQKRAEEALRRSEAYLAEAQRLSQTGSWVWSPDEGIRYWSEECYRVLSFDPRNGLPRFEEFLERIHPDDQPCFRELVQTAIREKAEWEADYRIVHPDGHVRDIHVVGHPALSTSGHLLEFVGTVIDITARKRAEQERERLRHIEAELAHINRVSMLGEMAASLAHEIKQPIAAAITSANSCIEWLAHEPPNLARARAAATKVDKYGNRAAEIIDRIRSFYRKSSPERELVDVNGIIREMLALLKGEASRYSVTMRSELAAELPKIMADPVQLQQVFMNLIVNGIEAMVASGGELSVTSQVDPDGNLLFSVIDTGVGLSTEDLQLIFSAFHTTKPQGSGMGLAISRSIVESHGGRLWASANGRQGATFHFTLPTQATRSG